MLNRLQRFQSEEHSLTAFLVILVLELFVVFPTEIAGAGMALVREIVFYLMLFAGLLTVWRGKGVRWFVIVLLSVIVMLRWVYNIFNLPGLAAWNVLSTFFFFVSMLAVITVQVNRPGPVTGHRIRGAIAAYLLLAVIFAYLYAVIGHVIPTPFQVPASWPAQMRERGEAFLYFSVVTLTTVGFGDVTPVHPFARTLVMLEALIGQLFPAIVIARLVSLEIEARRLR